MCACRCRRGRGRSHGRLPLRLSAFRFRYFLSLVFPFVAFVIRAEAALANAATRHGAPNQIGGDGSKQWRGTTRALRCVARTRFYFHLSPEGRGRANAVSEGEGDRMFQFRVRYPLTPTISPTGRGRRTARRENEILFFLLPAAWGEVGLPTGPARSGRPDDRLRERIRGIGCFSFRVWYPLTPTLSPAGRGSTQGRVARARHYAGRAP